MVQSTPPDARALVLDAPAFDGHDDLDVATLEAMAGLMAVLDPVSTAAQRLRGLVVSTPVLRSRVLDDRAGAQLWFKAENLQHIGAFKARGALNCMTAMPRDRLAAGVVTYSSGNHGQAVAHAARELGVPATVAMPVDAPAIKRAAIEAMGARVLEGGRTSLDRRPVAGRGRHPGRRA